MSDRVGGIVVGILGLGGLGLPVAAGIAKAMPILGYDPGRSPGESVHGVRTVDSVAAVGHAADVVILCLPGPEVSTEVVAELAALSPRRTSLLVEMSTVGIATAQTSAQIAESAGLGYLDAPVSGLQRKAWRGELTVMAAGAADLVARARPIFDLIAEHVFVMGARPGLGQAMKLANNVINATSFVITSEAVLFGLRAGLDLEQMIDVLNVSTGRTSASAEKFPDTVLPGSYGGGAPGEVISKDVSLFLQAAEQTGTPTGLARASGYAWADYARHWPNTDSVAMYRYLAGDEQ